jgi:pre-mRNA-splicing factor ATP-dependent RNA helicase DHX15/PRP43
MERVDIDLASRLEEGPRFYNNIRMALVCGFFMQVAHREGERGGYKTVKDNQASELILCVTLRNSRRRAFSAG